MSKMRTILAEVAKEKAVSESDLLSKSRIQKITLARQEAMQRMYATGALSTTQIGRFFNCDHTNILYACRRVAERRGHA
jgi:chromosomal replication initiation ATPase DnaA